MSLEHAIPAARTREEHARQARILELLTLGWNTVEAGVAILAGLSAGSIALVGFGADSVVECLSGAVLLWRLRIFHDDEGRDRLALRLVGLSLLALATYIAVDAGVALVRREAPDASPVGIALASLSLIVMPLLARAKRRAAALMGSAALQADSRQTDFCAYLSAILLAGLILNAAVGWWWADPVAGLGMTLIIAREGILATRGQSCTCSG